MAITKISVYSDRIFKRLLMRGVYSKGSLTSLGKQDDGSEIYGVLNFYVAQGVKIKIHGEDKNYAKRMKNISITVESVDKNEVYICYNGSFSITKQNDGLYTNVIPLLCTKMKQDYFNCGRDSEEGFKYQELVFTFKYDIKDNDGVERSYTIESEKIKFVTGVLAEMTTKSVLDSMEIPSFYRPFFFNAVLLLFPKNFGIDSNTHSYEFLEKVRRKGEDNLTKAEDSKECHGRLFYSIANGISLKENIEEKGFTDGRYVSQNVLEKVTLDINQGQYNLTVKNPFRSYDELNNGDNGDNKNNASTVNAIKKVLDITRKICFGITEPFTAISKENIVRDGIPIRNYNKNDNNTIFLQAQSLNNLDYFNNEKLSYEKLSDKDGNYKYPDRETGGKYSYFPLKKEDYVQCFKDNYNTSDFLIDTTEPLSVSLSVTDSSPEGYEGDNNTISMNYNGIRFYEEINQDKDAYYTVEGNSSKGVRYFLLMVNNEKKHAAPKSEVDNILRSIIDFSVSQLDNTNYKTPKIRYQGVHTNDYIKKSYCSYNGWQGIHTMVKIPNDGNPKFLWGTGDHACIDITSVLKRCEGLDTTTEVEEGVTERGIKHTCGNYRPVVIGLYDSYTSLDEDSYNTEKKNGNAIIKPHTNRFSIIKFYRVNYIEGKEE